MELRHIDTNYRTAELIMDAADKEVDMSELWSSMKGLLEDAFQGQNLKSVYFCVSRDDTDMIHFYDSHNFHEAVDIEDAILMRHEDVASLKWYSVLSGDWLEDPTTITGCRIIHISTIPTVNAGELSFFEAGHDIPFDIKRLYYISKVPEGMHRGFHAHKNLLQLLFCPYGRVKLILENELGREEIELSDPSIGLIIDRPTWREMVWLEQNSVLCVAASDYYTEDDYIRDYSEFKKYIKVE